MTNPAKPKELGRFPTGVTTGVHEVGIVQRPDGRVLALAAVPYSFNLSQGRQGDLRIIEITDPAGPELADWDVRRDGPAETRASSPPAGTSSPTAPGRSTRGTSCSPPSGRPACSSSTSATRPRPG